ncbi:MAG: nuclear transport factor 2 family protein [Gemmatimonadota bacterium]|jgi:hypothetical protein
MMRTTKTGGWSLVALLLVAPVPTLGQAPPDSDDEAAVLQVVTTLFDGMREKDESRLRSVFHPDARLHSAGQDEDGNPATRSTPIEGFIRNVVASEAFLDEVTFDERVEVSGNLAMAWTPYNLFVDGDFRHCGVDLFVMTRGSDGWKILQLADTRTQDGCDPQRRD